MIRQLPSYVDYCKTHSIDRPTTAYLLKEVPLTSTDWYDRQDSFCTGLLHGQFMLYYALKSFVSNKRDDKFVIYFITDMGLFVKEMFHSNWDFPLDFRNVCAKYVAPIEPGDLVINHPNRRSLMFLHGVRFTELIDGVAQPNSFDSTEIYESLKARTHTLLLESKDHTPVEVPFDIHLYRALRHRKFYIHVRLDNYINYREIRVWNPNL